MVNDGMTLLHQAAQKAVEALRLILPMAKGYAYNTHRVKANEDMCDQAAASLAALESALQQQPEPVALERWGRAKRDGSVLLERMADGYWTPWHIAQQALSALQHQEVPREPVARNALLAAWRAPEPVYFEFDKKKPKPDGFAAYTVLQLHRAFADGVDAASPSTTRQQEVGSGWKLVPVVPTPEMIAAYLRANDAYWKQTDELPTPPNKWRTGTPSDATAESYRAMLAAAPSTPEKAGGEKACAACKWPLSPCTCPAGVKGGQRG